MLKIKMISKKRFFLFLLGIISLIAGFIFGENAAGGGEKDFLYFLPYIDKFSLNFIDGFNSYIKNPGVSIQPPTFYIFVAFFSNTFSGLLGFKIFYLILCLLLPYIFFKILKEKFNQDSDLLFYLSLLIFISPYFRTSAIWSLGDNLSLIFFGLFVFNLIKAEKSYQFKYYLYSLIFLIIASYIRHYYSIFWMFFIFVHYKNLKFKYLPQLLIISLISSIPAILYFSNLFFSQNYLSAIKNYTNLNFIFTIVQTLTIIFFYIFPFVFFCRKEIAKFIENKANLFLIIIISILFIFAFQYYNFYPLHGGGVFFKLYKFTDLYTLIYISIFLAISTLFFLIKNDNKILYFQNFLLFFCLICAFPFHSIFQKYLDPLIYFVLFGLLESKQIDNMIKFKKISLSITYIYFGSFLILAIIYNEIVLSKIS